MIRPYWIILVSDKDVSNIESSMEKELSVGGEWLIDNTLSFLLENIASILFGFQPRLNSKSALSIRVKALPLRRKNQ